MTLNKKISRIVVIAGLFVLLLVTATWASPDITWQPQRLVPESVAPQESREFLVTLQHTGFLPIPATHQLKIITEGNIASFITITQPNWPSVLKRGNEVTVKVQVSVPQGTPLSVERGELLIKRILPNGKIKEVWRAEALPVELTFSSIPLPPDPGEAGKATLEGIDSDQNEVRDDIDRYIVFTYPDSAKKREGMKQYSLSTSAYLRDRQDKAKTRENGATDDKAIDCLAYVFNDDLDARNKAFEEVLAQFLNTQARSLAYRNADSQMGGYVSDSGPSNERLIRQKLACAFDADFLPN